MAARQIVVPSETEILNFSKDLYNYLWIKFKLMPGPGHRATLCPESSMIFTEDIGKAVLCEQLIMREVTLKSIFVYWTAIIVSYPYCAHVFCMAFFLSQCKWSLKKKFFRCCAFISEFTLFRRKLVDDQPLGHAHLLFKIVFDDLFSKVWNEQGGWRGFHKYARECINPLYHLFESYMETVTDPLDYNVPVVHRLPDFYEFEHRFRRLENQKDAVNIDIAAAYHSLVNIFLGQLPILSSEVHERLRGLSLGEDGNPSRTTANPKREVFTGPAFVSNQSLPDEALFKMITPPFRRFTLFQIAGSIPIYKPEPVRPQRAEDVNAAVAEIQVPQQSTRKRPSTEANPEEGDESKRAKSENSIDLEY